VPSGVFWKEIVERSIKRVKSLTTAVGSGAGEKNDESTPELKEVMMIEEAWMQPYLAYMINKKLPEDAVEAKKNNSTIESICRIAGKIIQKDHNWHFAALRNASRRTSNIKRYTHRSMWPSC
jgi:hypothetical protein